MSDPSSIPPPAPRRVSGAFGSSGGPIAPMSGAAAFGWTFVVTFLFLALWALVGSAREASKSDLVASFVCQLIAYSLGLFLILRVYAPERSIRDFLGMRRTSWVMLPLALLLGVVVTAPADTIYNLICARFPPPPDLDLLGKAYQVAPLGRRILMGVILCGAGPLIEEIFFRGALFRPLKRKVGVPLGAVLIAILFALVHLEWQTFGPILILGLCLGLLRAWSGSLYVSLFVHAAFNAVAFANLLHESTGAAPFSLTPAMNVAASALSVVLLVMAYFICKKSPACEAAREADA